MSTYVYFKVNDSTHSQNVYFYLASMPSCCGMNLVYSMNINYLSMNGYNKCCDAIFRFLAQKPFPTMAMDGYEIIDTTMKVKKPIRWGDVLNSATITNHYLGSRVTVFTDSEDKVGGPRQFYQWCKDNYPEWCVHMENGFKNPVHADNTRVGVMAICPPSRIIKYDTDKNKAA